MNFLVLITLLSPSANAGTAFHCPPTKNKLAFAALDLFDGDPKDNAQLKPNNGDDPFPHYWNLGGLQAFATCGYGAKREILVQKKLPKGLKKCTTHEHKKGSKVYDELSCD